MSDQKSCPKCGESIMANAQKCKHCNSDLRNWFVKHKIISGILALFLFGTVMNAINPSSSAPSSAPSTPSQRISATQLYAAYDANGIAADEAYKGETLEVYGKVGTVSKDILDSMYVTLKTSNVIASVQCMLEESELNEAMALRENMDITVIGKVNGKFMNVLLDNCTIQ